MSSGHQRIKWRRNIAENFNRLSRVHEHYRQTDDRQTDGQRHIANMNMSSRSLKIQPFLGFYPDTLVTDIDPPRNKCCVSQGVPCDAKTVQRGIMHTDSVVSR